MWIPDSLAAAENAVDRGLRIGLARYLKRLDKAPPVSVHDERLVGYLAEEVMNALHEDGEFTKPNRTERA